MEISLLTTTPLKRKRIKRKPKRKRVLKKKKNSKRSWIS